MINKWNTPLNLYMVQVFLKRGPTKPRATEVLDKMKSDKRYSSQIRVISNLIM
ncbi:hypothetical protein [Romboutsia sp.]|uniref:hypothetical protein n=1 Tax=Romboutsia sp. TaxID=1965302 RepID=UPI002BF0497C|nr:hypothetical protein [Romboutsia sp.]HSQ90470.1 hypothetical protein [Romboutsia sp.]